MKPAALTVKIMLDALIVVISIGRVQGQNLYHEELSHNSEQNGPSLGQPFARELTFRPPQTNPGLEAGGTQLTTLWSHHLPQQQRYQPHELNFIAIENHQQMFSHQPQAHVVALSHRQPKLHEPSHEQHKKKFEQHNNQRPSYYSNGKDRQQQLDPFQQQRGQVVELSKQYSHQPPQLSAQTLDANKNYQQTPVLPHWQQATSTPKHQYQQQRYPERQTQLVERLLEAPQQLRPHLQYQQQHQRLLSGPYEQQSKAPFPPQQQQQSSKQIQQFANNQQIYQPREYTDPAQRYQRIQVLNAVQSTNFQSPYDIRTSQATASSSLPVSAANIISQQPRPKNGGQDNKLQPFLPSYYSEENSSALSTYGIDLCSVCCNPDEDPCTNCCGSEPFLSAAALKVAAG